ncbi:MAG: hypothetical protein WC139_09015 [Candidatus Kapaibacterium sp.]
MNKLISTLSILILLTTIKTVYSQKVPTSQQINIKAEVISHSIVVSKRDLDFGNDIVPGIAKSINKASENSGSFEIQGKKNKAIKVSFTLPEILTNSSNLIDISFSSTDAGYITNGNMKAFDPRKGVNTKLSGSGKMEIFLGGTITPSNNQASGFYSAPIIVHLLYTAD